jgi:ABC-type branched-subunit amino acid transport system substrate-binding protein
MDIPYSPTIEFSDIIVKAKAANPDFLHFVMYPHEAFIFLKQMRDLKLNVKALADAGPVTMLPQMREVLGDDANYILDDGRIVYKNTAKELDGSKELKKELLGI